MKITKQHSIFGQEDRFNINVSEFELQVLVGVAWSVVAQGQKGEKSNSVFSYSPGSLLAQGEKFVFPSEKVFNVKYNSYKDRLSSVNLVDIPQNPEKEQQKTQPNKRDKSGRFVTDKKYLCFKYPKPEYRNLSDWKLRDCHIFRDNVVFDKRKIFNPYIKDNYLYGNDCSDGMKLKKFCLDKVFGRRYSVS